MDIVLASKNRKKIKELETLLASISSVSIRVLSLEDIGYEGDIEENGLTFEENARIKASVPASMGYIGIADDSGLAVDALGGMPGVYSARYAALGQSENAAELHNASDAENNAKLLLDLADVPDEKRTARFVSAVACVFPDNGAISHEPIVVRGECEGKILREAAGDGGFGYDPLFFYEPDGKTFAALSAERKNEISHRGMAMRKFAEKFSEIMTVSLIGDGKESNA